MQSSQIEHLKKLLDCEETRILTKEGGGNSKVFCAEVRGKKWAVKSYPPYAPNQRDRLAAECTTYQFLNQHQVPSVPTFKTACPTERWLVIDWIEGNIPNTYSASDVEQAINFIRQIAKLNQWPEAHTLPLAAEACLSLNSIIKQIEQRFERLSLHTSHEPALHDFLLYNFLPLFAQSKTQAINGYLKNNLNPQSELASELRSLIPADFGFHNTLRDAAGKLYFFDFDYFGWDDPVKLLADILWHPKMNLSEEQKQQFITGISLIYNHDSSFLSRFQYTFPLFGLRWALILLNEFIPAFWQNRQHAEAHQNHFDAKSNQLKRAKELLKLITNQRGPEQSLA
jgi:thiamine kinase-like enzyme